MAHVVKDNRCFADAYAPKYKGSSTDTVEADDSQLFTFYDDSIAASDACAVSVVHIDGNTIDDIKTNHTIGEGAVQVKVWNSGLLDAEITVNVVVL
jgi:hypothetical protein